jgi:hypothetical protein
MVTPLRRALGAAALLVALAGTAWLHHAATDFPAGEQVRVVDAALVARLRAEPGLHLPLAPDHELRVELDLADDPVNRLVYGTSVDLRERADRRAIHIQVKDGRGAIHTDDHNPKAGVGAWLLHASLDVPFLPFPLVGVMGSWLLVGGRRRGAGARDAAA